jgi:hypothetical protein
MWHNQETWPASKYYCGMQGLGHYNIHIRIQRILPIATLWKIFFHIFQYQHFETFLKHHFGLVANKCSCIVPREQMMHLGSCHCDVVLLGSIVMWQIMPQTDKNALLWHLNYGNVTLAFGK